MTETNITECITLMCLPLRGQRAGDKSRAARIEKASGVLIRQHVAVACSTPLCRTPDEAGLVLYIYIYIYVTHVYDNAMMQRIIP